MPSVHHRNRLLLLGSRTLLKNLVAYWSQNGSANDSGSNSLHFTSTNVVFSPGLAGRNCASFLAASGRFLTLESAPAITNAESGDFTFSFWVNTTTTGASFQFLIAKNAASPRGFNVICVHNGGSPYISTTVYNTTPAGFATTGESITYGNWYHVVAQHIVASKTVRQKINNGSWISNNYTGTYQTNAAPLRIGGSSDASPSFLMNGSVQDCGFWSRQLSDTEIALIFNLGVPVTYPNFR
jgi:hypothetical protein